MVAEVSMWRLPTWICSNLGLPYHMVTPGPPPSTTWDIEHPHLHLRTLNNGMDLYNITDSDGDSCNDFDCNGFDWKAFLSVTLSLSVNAT